MKPMEYTPPVYDATVADKPAITWKNGDRTSFIFAHELVPHIAGKRLSDAECAAERWHAAFYFVWPLIQIMTGQREHTDELAAAIRKQSEEAIVWARFMKHSHAFEGGQ